MTSVDTRKISTDKNQNPGSLCSISIYFPIIFCHSLKCLWPIRLSERFRISDATIGGTMFPKSLNFAEHRFAFLGTIIIRTFGLRQRFVLGEKTSECVLVSVSVNPREA